MIKKLLTSFLVFFLFLNANATTPQTNIIIPFNPGGGTDKMYRIFEKFISSKKIELNPTYRPGADGLVGTQVVLSDNTGRLLGMSGLHSLIEAQKFNKTDEAQYIGVIGLPAMVLLSSQKSGITSFSEFEVKIKNKVPLTIGYGSLNQKTNLQQLLKELNASTEVILVPYQGGGSVLNNLLGSHIDIAFVPATIAMKSVEAKKINLLASTGDLVDFKTLNLEEKYPNWVNVDVYLIFMSKNATKETITYWRSILKDFLLDKDSNQLMKKEFIDVPNLDEKTFKRLMNHAQNINLKVN